jgi:uncharacterized protein (DUF433 family)
LFLTDGRNILMEAGSRIAFVNLFKSQLEFKRIVAPFLKELEFAKTDRHQIVRWWPEAGKGRIVVDPERSFGQAIVKREGVPTSALAQAYVVEQSYERVARWYEVAERSVRDAVEFEEQLAA